MTENSSQPAPPEKQHASGDLDHAEDAPAAGEAPTNAAVERELDDSLALDAAEESREKWWESSADEEL